MSELQNIGPVSEVSYASDHAEANGPTVTVTSKPTLPRKNVWELGYNTSEAKFGNLEGTYKASPGSVYTSYTVKVDQAQGDRAQEFQLFSFSRPHMRALHCAWISFFLAFFIWFAITPLMAEIQHDLSLSKREVWSSTIRSETMTILARIFVGPLCDKFGARIPMAVVLSISSIPVACIGLIQNAAQLSIVRAFIGIAGSSFVMAQYWPTRMFTSEIAGSVNGLVAGWGNLGGGVAQPIMGSVLFPAFTNVFDGDSEKSWRVICIIPAVITLIWGLIVSFISDDAPMGYYKDMKRNGTMDSLNLSTHFRNGWSDVNIWIMYIQYACCFGVEIIMNNVLVLYFTSEFGLTTPDAAALAGLFGLMNIIFRFLGGWASDQMNLWNGLRGRLWLQTLLILCEGALIVVFANRTSLAMSVVKMCLCSVFVQAAEGSTYGIVPYLNVAVHGSVAGLVGGGGSAGGIVFALCFRSLSYRRAFEVMGIVVMASSILSIFIKIPGHAGLISGEDSLVVIEKRTRHNRITAVPTSEAETDNNLKQPDIDGESDQNFGEA